MPTVSQMKSYFKFLKHIGFEESSVVRGDTFTFPLELKGTCFEVQVRTYDPEGNFSISLRHPLDTAFMFLCNVNEFFAQLGFNPEHLEDGQLDYLSLNFKALIVFKYQLARSDSEQESVDLKNLAAAYAAQFLKRQMGPDCDIVMNDFWIHSGYDLFQKQVTIEFTTPNYNKISFTWNVFDRPYKAGNNQVFSYLQGSYFDVDYDSYHVRPSKQCYDLFEFLELSCFWTIALVEQAFIKRQLASDGLVIDFNCVPDEKQGGSYTLAFNAQLGYKGRLGLLPDCSFDYIVDWDPHFLITAKNNEIPKNRMFIIVAQNNPQDFASFSSASFADVPDYLLNRFFRY